MFRSEKANIWFYTGCWFCDFRHTIIHIFKTSTSFLVRFSAYFLTHMWLRTSPLPNLAGTFTFSLIVTEESTMETSVSPFWKTVELRLPLKLKNWQLTEKSWFTGAQLMENSDMRKFSHISRGFSPVKKKSNFSVGLSFWSPLWAYSCFELYLFCHNKAKPTYGCNISYIVTLLEFLYYYLILFRRRKN